MIGRSPSRFPFDQATSAGYPPGLCLQKRETIALPEILPSNKPGSDPFLPRPSLRVWQIFLARCLTISQDRQGPLSTGVPCHGIHAETVARCVHQPDAG